MTSQLRDPRSIAFLLKHGVITPEEISKEELVEAVKTDVKPLPKLKQEMRIGYPPGFAGEMASWICDSGFKRQPLLSIGAALACLSAILGQRVMTSTGMRPNIYVLNLAPTAAGKDHGRRMIDQSLSLANAEKIIGGDDIVSDVSVIDQLSQQPQLVFLLDEFGKFIKRTSGNTASSYQQGILDILMKLYSLSDGTYRSGWTKSTQTRTVIRQPHVTLFATATPEQFWPLVNQDLVSNGFLNRFFVFESKTETPEIQKVDEPKVPASVISRLKCLYALPIIPLGADPSCPKPVAVRYSEEAEECLLSAQASWQDKAMDQSNKARDLWKRAGDMARKTALILSSAGFSVGEISQTSLEEMEWAVKLVEALCSNASNQAAVNMAENRHESEIQRLLLKIGEKTVGITNRELARKTQYLSTQYRNQLLQQMLEIGLIEETLIENEVRRSKGWKLSVNDV